MIERTIPLNQLRKFKDMDIIKVVTGMRRSGKSTLFKLYIQWLKAQGIQEDHIIYINLESANYDNIQDYHALYSLVKSSVVDYKKYYVFIDEVQNVKNFEKAVNSLCVDLNIDLYLTGSNAFLLSGELATLLSGRYVEIKMHTLSFSEYFSVHSEQNIEDAMLAWLKFGGFPFLAQTQDETIISDYLDGIYNTIVLKDIIQKNNIKDTSLLKSILNMVLSSIGSIISSSSICKALKAEGRIITNETVEKYLQVFCNAFILEKVVRYDIKGKAYLKTLNKYYVSDLGLRNHILGFRQIEPTHALENAVYFELVRQGYKVDIGALRGTNGHDKEIDFVARKDDTIEYYQVSYTVNNPDTLERELSAFNSIQDHYPKYLITMDKDFVNNLNGVKKLYAPEWFLGKPHSLQEYPHNTSQNRQCTMGH
ncbi:MAG: ATP-binding protein [Sphaerochaetaceae bacterium]|nr:ATP-binding protein [Sphaerochaetaceae bacterium]